jgi:hypothetical protein
MKMAVFGVVAPCSLVQVYRRLTHRPDHGGSKDLRNLGKILPDYTVQHPRRQPSSVQITSLLHSSGRQRHVGYGIG